ncbi:hypothetical protein FAZ69_27175 [Trinickia terrae]|uniref:TfoX/Sxy family protein n=1 Tax=Trinickia terrae TaxID=2571161 RepID=A0A4V5PH14_9BURK|nr:hypothetical protein [Trinickia terrae]TKC81650.1 hypothetical protein FAZ69_27175 [Trinickia terrae]
MNPTPRLLHDRFLFDAAFNEVRDIDAPVREGAMFGCPAAFVGRRIAFCVYGSGLGIKLPAERAAALLESGRAFAFQPYGRAAMTEWVELRIQRDRVDEIAPVLAEAVRFAQRDHGRAS